MPKDPVTFILIDFAYFLNGRSSDAMGSDLLIESFIIDKSSMLNVAGGVGRSNINHFFNYNKFWYVICPC